MRKHIRTTFLALGLTGALSVSVGQRAAHAIDFGGLAKEAAGTAQQKATETGKAKANEAVINKVNKKLLADGRKNQCNFKVDSDELEPGCEKKAQNLVKALIDAKKQLQAAGVSVFKFEVSGHTDSSGKADHNKELSAKRATAMAKELTSRGVDPKEVIAVGMGSEKPLVTPDNTEAKKKKNRRYEIQVRI
jgi:outer membrane protein OmpA-like peptidoglycan-associated protein